MIDYKRVLFGLCFILTIPASGYVPAEGNVTALLGPYIHRSDFSGPSHVARPPVMGGAGLIATGDLNHFGSLEIAMFYMPKVYFRKVEDKFLAERMKLMHITMGYRYAINRTFSVSAGLFSSYPMGSPQTVYSDFQRLGDADTSARDSTEYGFDFSVQADLATITDELSVVFDGRYSLSVTGKKDESANEYGGLVGIRYLFREKGVDPTASVKEKP